jgi:hypothetical protein
VELQKGSLHFLPPNAGTLVGMTVREHPMSDRTYGAGNFCRIELHGSPTPWAKFCRSAGALLVSKKRKPRWVGRMTGEENRQISWD